MDPWLTVLISVITTTIASSGFWTYLMARREKSSATTRLLMGLAHDKILYLGMKHIELGHISREDYEDLRKYLYEPYLEMGGNGTVERVMKEVSNLPLTVRQVLLKVHKEEEGRI